MSQYKIQHALWMYPDGYFVGSDRQPTIRAHDVELLDIKFSSTVIGRIM